MVISRYEVLLFKSKVLLSWKIITRMIPGNCDSIFKEKSCYYEFPLGNTFAMYPANEELFGIDI